MYRPEKSPAVVLRQFKQSTPAKTEADFLVGDEIEKALRYFQQMREENKYPLHAQMYLRLLYLLEHVQEKFLG